MRWSEEFSLNRGLRILFVLLNLGLGLIPGMVLFFFWVERNCQIPFLGTSLGFPWFRFAWLNLPESSLALKVGWNVSLFFQFGFLHSAFAQKSVQKRVEVFLPPQTIRTFYLAVTGVALFWMMAAWQNTGLELWNFQDFQIFEEPRSTLISMLIFWSCMLGAGRIIARFDELEFLGLRQLFKKVNEISRTEGMQHLVVQGMYRYVRHPVYSLTLAAFLLTPQMTLDRFLVVFSMALYLCVGIPIEERKLVRQFGRAYLDYRLKTKAVIPGIW